MVMKETIVYLDFNFSCGIVVYIVDKWKVLMLSTSRNAWAFKISKNSLEFLGSTSLRYF